MTNIYGLNFRSREIMFELKKTRLFTYSLLYMYTYNATHYHFNIFIKHER